ncbi:MAG: hypothetical protein LBG21_06750, partial [Campylobacteraceae bacterium]|nr:hypothetical protein [Campylobacteraceae bacterium]
PKYPSISGNCLRYGFTCIFEPLNKKLKDYTTHVFNLPLNRIKNICANNNHSNDRLTLTIYI